MDIVPSELCLVKMERKEVPERAGRRQYMVQISHGEELTNGFLATNHRHSTPLPGPAGYRCAGSEVHQASSFSVQQKTG